MPSRYTGGLSPTGPAADGEVEDHVVSVVLAVSAIGLAKRVVSIDPNPGDPNAFSVTFGFTAVNSGNVNLAGAQITDDLVATLAGVSGLQVTAVSAAGTLTANLVFDGTVNKNLLATGSTLAAGASATVTLTVSFRVTGLRQFFNTATATGMSNIQAVTDVSTDGTDPDPDHDGNPGNNSGLTLVSLPTLPVPKLDNVALLSMSLLLALLGVREWRRRARGDAH